MVDSDCWPSSLAYRWLKVAVWVVLVGVVLVVVALVLVVAAFWAEGPDF